MTRRRAGKWMWYGVAVILLLSLPTFSTLTPELRVATPLLLHPSGRVAVPLPIQTEPVRNGAARSSPPVLSSRVLDGPPEPRAPLGPVEGTTAPAPHAEAALPPQREIAEAVVETGAARRPESEPFRKRTLFDYEGDWEQELQGLEQAFDLARNTLFDRFNFGLVQLPNNPFQQALQQDPSPDPGPADTGTGEPADTGTNPGPGQGGDSKPDPGNSNDKGNPSSGSGEGSTPDRPPDPFRFLIIGQVGDREGVFRASRDPLGRFVLEDSTVLDLLPGTVAFFRPMLTFGRDQKVLLDDLNGDTLLDYIVVTVRFPESAIDSFLQKEGGRFEVHLHGSILFQDLASLALHDMDGNGEPEIAGVVRRNPNLVIFQRVLQFWDYQKEFALPFEAAFVLSTERGGLLREKRLLIFDRTLSNVAMLSSRRRGQFQFLSPQEFSGNFANLQMDLDNNGEKRKLLVYQDGGRIALLEEGVLGWTQVVSVNARFGLPLILIGDVEGIGSRQILVFP